MYLLVPLLHRMLEAYKDLLIFLRTGGCQATACAQRLELSVVGHKVALGGVNEVLCRPSRQVGALQGTVSMRIVG